MTLSQRLKVREPAEGVSLSPGPQPDNLECLVPVQSPLPWLGCLPGQGQTLPSQLPLHLPVSVKHSETGLHQSLCAT